MTGAGLSADRPHLSLHAIERGGGVVSQDVVDAARTAAARVKCAALPIVFDQFRTFSHSSTCVLRCDADSKAAVKHLRDLLKAELR